MAGYKGRTADIKIKPSTTEHILQHCHDEDTYSVTSPRGRLLLINNQEFDTPVYPEQKHLNDRPGSEIDCDRLEELFKQLDFIVKVQENVSSKFMTELLEKETRVEEQEQYGMFILIILSHGDESCIYGKDGCPLYYKDIYKQLSARSFRAMAGKPKLLLFQACSGSSTEKSQLNEDSREVDDEAAAVSGSFKARPQTAQISANSDLLIIRSSFPGYVSARRGDKGSHLMRVFIEVMQQYSCQEELEILSKKVRSTVYNLCEEDKAMFDKYGHQTIHNSSTLTKSLYFFPGYDPTKPPQNELEPVLTADGASSIGCDSQPDHNPDIATEPPKPAPRTSRQKLTAQPEVDLDRVIREHDNFDDDLSSSAEPIIDQELIFTTDEDVKKLFAHPNVYKMSVGCRGRALILNNVEFEQKVNPDQDDLDYREGSDVDCTNIKTVLEKLGFIVTVKTDRDTRQMRNEIQKETEREDQAHYGMFILVVLSHGDRDVVYGSDGRKISSDDIVDLLKPQKFVGMKGKPKWIIQQTCSGVKADNVQPDSNPADVPPLQRTNKTAQPYTSVSDLYILKSSFPGYISLRDRNYGSYMIQDLVKVLYRFAAHKDLQSLTTEVRNRVMERSGTGDHKFGVQTVYDSGTLRKKIYLFPGYKSQLPILDKPTNIPIRLRETSSNTNTPTTLSNPAIPALPIPTRLQYRKSQTAPNDTFFVHFTKEGKLFYSGANYGISGLSFTPKIPTDDKRWNSSICEHNNHLYLLQYHDEHTQYYVHKINLSDRSVSENIIKFIGSDCLSQHLVVNDEFIFISDYTAKCVRVYSSNNSAHLFNIKHEFISVYPWGVGLLGDSLVVGDNDQDQVSNMTINETPEVRWTCTEIDNPTALRVVDNPQMILVGSDTTKQIYILSYQGQKLSTLAVPECSEFGIGDIAVYGKQIVVADGTNEIKVYEMTE